MSELPVPLWTCAERVGITIDDLVELILENRVALDVYASEDELRRGGLTRMQAVAVESFVRGRRAG